MCPAHGLIKSFACGEPCIVHFCAPLAHENLSSYRGVQRRTMCRALDRHGVLGVHVSVLKRALSGPGLLCAALHSQGCTDTAGQPSFAKS